MKKKMIIFSNVLFGVFAFSQNGRVGINTTSPTETLDVNGNIRIRNVNTVTGLATDAVTSAGRFGVLSYVTDVPRTVSLSIGGLTPNQSNTVTLPDGFDFSRINVFTGNACGRYMLATFTKSGDLVNFLGAQGRGVPGQWTASATANGGNVIFPGVTGCADGGNGIQFNFEISMTGSSVTITNKGNVSKSYTVVATTNL